MFAEAWLLTGTMPVISYYLFEIGPIISCDLH